MITLVGILAFLIFLAYILSLLSVNRIPRPMYIIHPGEQFVAEAGIVKQFSAVELAELYNLKPWQWKLDSECKPYYPPNSIHCYPLMTKDPIRYQKYREILDGAYKLDWDAMIGPDNEIHWFNRDAHMF